MWPTWQGSKVFISLKKSNSPGAKAGQINVQSFKQTCDKENVLNINLDLQNQNINFNLGSGLKGEIDLKKTFIFGNWIHVLLSVLVIFRYYQRS